MKKDILSRIVQLTETDVQEGRQLEQLGGVLRGWRMLGCRVWSEVGDAVVGESPSTHIRFSWEGRSCREGCKEINRRQTAQACPTCRREQAD